MKPLFRCVKERTQNLSKIFFPSEVVGIIGEGFQSCEGRWRKASRSFLVYALQEESDGSEGVVGVGARFPECWGIE